MLILQKGIDNGADLCYDIHVDRGKAPDAAPPAHANRKEI